jgi:tRNA(Arg) A34 adenosine deaminase TadA
MQNEFMREAIRLAADNIKTGCGGPFGAVIVRQGEIIARGSNQVTSTNDPTAHAEIVAIRRACESLGDFSLAGCEIFASCEPCPMCLAALYWAGIEKITYAADRHDAASIGFADEHIYLEINKKISQRSIKLVQLGRNEALDVFAAWNNLADKIAY